MKRATFLFCSFALHLINFNPRPREEGDFITIISRITISDFNPRPREEGDCFRKSLRGRSSLFQSTPSWRGRPDFATPLSYCWQFQSTPSWRGRRLCCFCCAACRVISIHALVKRATENYIEMITLWDISIHALVKRATLISSSSYSITVYFNPRPREEGDYILFIQVLILCYFNPRPREEGD